MRLHWGAASDRGQLRPGNEDAAVAEEGLFAVADGMGGHAGGEVASQVAIQALRESVSDHPLAEAVGIANRAVIDRAAGDPALRGMGTTICALTLEGDRAVIVNVGDSRGYLYRDGELSQVTNDHNLVAELERDGRISHEEALVHPQRNIITRVLGNDLDVEVDEFSVDPFRGDRFLLCSDGLFNEVDEGAIAAVLRTEPDPQAAAEELVRLANAGGGRDNITVVLADVVDDDDRARTASAALAGSAATSVLRPSPADPTKTKPHRAIDADLLIEPPPPRRFTWRTALFLLAVLLVVAAAVGSVYWFGRNTYYVGEDGGQVTIFRGKPGGVLWIDPTVEERTDLAVEDVPPARRRDVEAGHEVDDLADAHRYVANLEEQAEELEQATTTTTSTTSTTIAGPTTSTAPP